MSQKKQLISALVILSGSCVIFAIFSGCTYIRVDMGDGAGDVWVDTPYKARSTTVDNSGEGDVDADTSGTTEGAEASLPVELGP